MNVNIPTALDGLEKIDSVYTVLPFRQMVIILSQLIHFVRTDCIFTYYLCIKFSMDSHN